MKRIVVWLATWSNQVCRRWIGLESGTVAMLLLSLLLSAVLLAWAVACWFSPMPWLVKVVKVVVSGVCTIFVTPLLQMSAQEVAREKGWSP